MIPRKIMAVEVASDTIRGVLVGKKGRRFSIIDFASLKRPAPEDDLPDIDTLKKLAQLLKYTGRNAVYVTALARSSDLFMDKKKVAHMSVYQLSESAKWEIEPYTGISGSNALVGVEKEKKPKAKPGEIVYEEDSDEVMVNISAIERNVYVAIKERFKAAGLKLNRIYPPEVSFYMPLFLENMDTPRAILEVGPDYSNFAIFRGRHPEQISTLNFSCDAIQSHLDRETVVTGLEESLKFTFSQAPEHEAVVLTGPGAAQPEIARFLGDFSISGASPLLLAKTSGVTAREPDPGDAVFGTAAGAGIRELKGTAFRQVGVDDSEPLLVRIKKNAYIMPLVATGLIAMVLLGHNQYMKYQERRFKQEIITYTRQLKENKETISRFNTLQEKSAKIKKDIQNYRNKINYISKEADRNIAGLIRALNTIAESLPEPVVLEVLAQDESEETVFTVKGVSSRLKSIGEFATLLQAVEWCDSAAIETIQAAENRRLYFEMRMITRLGHTESQIGKSAGKRRDES